MNDDLSAGFIENELTFEFLEVEGRARYFDFIVAGEDFYGFEFVSGPYEGRRIFCRRVFGDEDNDTAPLKFYYSADVSSDGMVLNRDPSRPLGPDEEGDSLEGIWGGGYYPDWDTVSFTIKETDRA